MTALSKKTILSTALFALFGLSLTGSLIYAASAADSPPQLKAGMHEDRMHPDRGPWKMDVSEETKTLLNQLRTAQEQSDTEQVTALRQQLKEQRDADRLARQEEMDTALAGGYEAWKAYVTEQGFPEEMISKITPENFSVLVELHETQKKAAELSQQLGLDDLGAHHMRM